MNRISKILALCVLSLIITSLILQVVAICSTHWASYTARTDLGKPQESGHYGLWSLCSTKGPHWTEDCDPLDTFFEVPPFITISGALIIIHIVAVLVLFLISIVRTVQILRNLRRLLFDPRYLCIINVAIAFASVILAILVAIFASIGENKLKEYTIVKGWSFWVQMVIVAIDFVVASLCTFQNFRVWQLYIREHADPTGRRAETYGNPAFENGSSSPNTSRDKDELTGDMVAVTEESGRPNPKTISKIGPFHFRPPDPDKHLGLFTYENPFFEERSPRSARSSN